ncbi:hypothetical protein BK133_01020 [Paenibacillus sp. FSL H8-0548]|uniref:phage antirepressor KilAC domain-containing protein n=1 Tax=Paenibacillus sp. FSL H8-0548 TaxID=1920422 RepID=UPI00096D8473|nr:phage antirepressor KilAC domain-containing protein [Paenibacillus sp. FSL H8-0548]OMF38816.1 hypothetical protein BK133_01020 [Paenibacillus sp. FSL H8-0548]
MKIIEYKGLRVLTTNQLAEAYGTDNKNLNDNYQNNAGRYKREKHFFLLEGDELKAFKASTEISGNLKYAPLLFLWTEKGSWLHAKSLNTDKAWEAYELLVDDYYDKKELSNSVVPSYMLEDPEERALQWVAELRQRKELENQKLLLEKAVTELKPKIAYLDTILQSKGLVTTTQIGKDYGLTAPELNKILHDVGIQYKVNDQWVLYKKYADKGYTQSYSFPFKHKDGTPDVKMNTQWTQRGRIFIHEQLTKIGIKANIEKEYGEVN